MTIAARTTLEDLDVHRSASPSLASFGPGIVYSRLLRFRTGPDVQTPSLALECDLCESWAWESPTTLRVSLRRGVLWQDVPPVNGRELALQDVTASLHRLRTPGWPGAARLANVASVAGEGYDLVFTLRMPDADFPLALADGHTKVLPVELMDVGGLGAGPFIGTGPWMTKVVNPNVRYSFDANPRYFEEGLPYLDALVVLVMPEEAIRRAAFLTRSVDVDEVSHNDWEEFRERNPEAGFIRYAPPGGGLELALNVSAPALQDVNVRRALFRAVDPWLLNKQMWHGLADVAGGMPSPSPEWRPTEAELRGHLADPDGARSLLQAAGGPPPAVELTVADFNDDYLRYGQGVREHLRSAGFQVTVRQLAPNLFVDQVWRRAEFQAALGPLPPLNAPNSYLVGLVHSGAARNTTGYSSPELDGLVDAQSVELDPSRRRDLARQVARTLLEQGVRFTPASPVQAWGWWPHVKGLHVNFANREYHFWAGVWLE